MLWLMQKMEQNELEGVLKCRKKNPEDKTSSNNIQQTNEKDVGNGIRKIVLFIATSAIKKKHL